jgi:nucleotidyltransferase/DNA polymerase involved in DNA repair
MLRSSSFDVDTFFLAVHARNSSDSSLLGDVRPVALWQYNDVICASQAARALGVRKHMTPAEARALLEPHGGRLLHAYWREWPGPRIWYGHYHAASRELFAALRAALAAVVGSDGYTLERASVDEAYIDVSAAASRAGAFADVGGHGLDSAVGIARRVLAQLATSELKLRISVGTARGPLLAGLVANAP